MRILPDIQIIFFKDFKELTLKFWKKHLADLQKHVVLESKHWYETRNVGSGCPPIKTNKGWLIIYHAVDDMDKGKTYRCSAALLDLKNPRKVIGHLHEPLLSPEMKYETQGNVPRVIFPTGTSIFKDRLYIYYGAADKSIAVASVNLQELLKELTQNPKNKGTR
jgi:beta-1,2-mannobiose phosphorylase / 1,2-beta-oligomannan phosphorylase